MDKIEARITVYYVDMSVLEELSGNGVFLFSVTSLGIQHDPGLHPAPMGCDHPSDMRGSENRNILMRRDFSACSMESSSGWAVSSGMTKRERDILPFRILCPGIYIFLCAHLRLAPLVKRSSPRVNVSREGGRPSLTSTNYLLQSRLDANWPAAAQRPTGLFTRAR